MVDYSQDIIILKPKTNVAHIDIPDVDVILTIPTYELKTEDSRVLQIIILMRRQFKIVRLAIQ